MLIKIRVELANLNYCAVPFLGRAVASLYWYNFVGLKVSGSIAVVLIDVYFFDNSGIHTSYVFWYFGI